MSDTFEIIHTLDAHRCDLYPLAILYVTARCGYFTQIDLWIKVRSKCIAMITTITVENIYGINGIKIVLFGICRIDTCNARIKAGSAKCRKTCRPKLLLICPLPGIIKISRKSKLPAALFVNCSPLRILCILRFIVRSIYVIHAGFQTGIHNRQILIRKRNIENRIRLIGTNQLHQLRCIIRIHLCRFNFCFRRFLNFFLQRLTFTDSSARNTDVCEYPAVLTAFADCHLCNSAATDYQYLSHVFFPPLPKYLQCIWAA